jgi:hypothetical protein
LGDVMKRRGSNWYWLWILHFFPPPLFP